MIKINMNVTTSKTVRRDPRVPRDSCLKFYFRRPVPVSKPTFIPRLWFTLSADTCHRYEIAVSVSILTSQMLSLDSDLV